MSLLATYSTTTLHHRIYIQGWNQIERNIWIAFSCQESLGQSWIPGAMSQFPLFIGLDGRSLLNWANKTDSVHKYSLCLLCKLTDCHFCCCYNLGNCIPPWRNVGRAGASKVKKKKKKKNRESEKWERTPLPWAFYLLCLKKKKNYTGLYWNSSALFQIIKCVTVLGTQSIL